MKKNFLQIFSTITVAAILAVGISYVSAWNPGAAVPTVITTNAERQQKDGIFMSEKYLASELGFFKNLLLPGNDSWLNIGGEFLGTTTESIFGIQNAGGTIPLTIHANNRATSTRDGIQGQDAIRFISGDTQCHAKTAIINNRASAFELVSTQNIEGHADIIARQLKLSGGLLKNNSVLVAVDNQGNAVWGTLSVENGQVAVRDNEGNLVVDGKSVSPVVSDALCTPIQKTYHWVTEWSGCKYVDDSVAPAVDKEDPLWSLCKDQDNNTVANDLCPSPAPSARSASSSLPSCYNIAQCYRLKSNCPHNAGTGVIIPSQCGLIDPNQYFGCQNTPEDPQEIVNVICPGGLDVSDLEGTTRIAAEISCSSTPIAWYCHTAGAPQWVTASSRGLSITCTSEYYPALDPGEYYSEGDIVCKTEKPSNDTCQISGGHRINACRQNDPVCPNVL